jgi:hypothetical protein
MGDWNGEQKQKNKRGKEKNKFAKIQLLIFHWHFRAAHNELEKNRRANLRGHLEALKSVLPPEADTHRDTTLSLLTRARNYIQVSSQLPCINQIKRAIHPNLAKLNRGNYLYKICIFFGTLVLPFPAPNQFTAIYSNLLPFPKITVSQGNSSPSIIPNCEFWLLAAVAAFFAIPFH